MTAELDELAQAKLRIQELETQLSMAEEQKGKVDDDVADKAFKFGYTLACCTLTNLHDQPGMAHDVLKDLGLTRQDVKAMDLSEYDAKALRKIERYTGHGQLYEKKRRKT